MGQGLSRLRPPPRLSREQGSWGPPRTRGSLLPLRALESGLKNAPLPLSVLRQTARLPGHCGWGVRLALTQVRLVRLLSTDGQGFTLGVGSRWSSKPAARCALVPGHGLDLGWGPGTARILPRRELPAPASPRCRLLSSLEALFGPAAQRGEAGGRWEAQERALHSRLRGRCL